MSERRRGAETQEREQERERNSMQQAVANNGVASLNLKTLLDAYERQLIQTALSAAAGNQRRAAASLGLLPTTLHEKMKRLGLVKRPPAASSPDAAQGEPAAAV